MDSIRRDMAEIRRRELIEDARRSRRVPRVRHRAAGRRGPLWVLRLARA